MTTMELILFSIVLSSCFIALILVLVFGQVTVRKLKSNPETKNSLGFEYMSGSNILNVVRALALSERKEKKRDHNSMSFLYANRKILIKHTTKFDRLLAKVLYYFLWFFMVSMLSLVILSVIGVFD